MRNVENLFNTLLSDLPMEKKYPQYNPQDNFVHVLFLSPMLSASGYYRMIAPMMELNKTSTHRALINKIHKWDFSKQFDDYDNPLDERLIKWAHYIVLPTIFSDITYIVNIIKDKNSEAVTYMDMDANCLELEEENPLSRKITMDKRKTLFSNLQLVDGLICSGESLAERVEQLMLVHTGKQINRPYVTEGKLSDEGFVNFKGLKLAAKNKTEDIVRVGLILSPADWQDVQVLIPVLEELQVEEKRMEIIVFGWGGAMRGENKMGELYFRYVKSVRIEEYLVTLRNLALDIILLPLKDSDYNRGKTAVKFLEASALGVPVVASNHFIYQDKIIDGENGFLAEEKQEWKEKIKLLIREQKLRQQMGENAKRTVWKNWSYEYDGIKSLLEVFK
jgi:glycosyltransferase involved in cell wall biosynthesis